MSQNYLFMLHYRYLTVLVYRILKQLSNSVLLTSGKYTPLVASTQREELLLNTPHRLIWEMTQPSVAKLNSRFMVQKKYNAVTNEGPAGYLHISGYLLLKFLPDLNLQKLTFEVCSPPYYKTFSNVHNTSRFASCLISLTKYLCQ